MSGLPFRPQLFGGEPDLDWLYSYGTWRIAGEGSVDAVPYAVTTLLVGAKVIEVDLEVSSSGGSASIFQDVTIGVSNPPLAYNTNRAVESVADRCDLYRRPKLWTVNQTAPDSFTPDVEPAADKTYITGESGDFSWILQFGQNIAAEDSYRGQDANQYQFIYYQTEDVWITNGAGVKFGFSYSPSGSPGSGASTNVNSPAVSATTEESFTMFGQPVFLTGSGISVSGTIDVKEWLED